MDNAPEALGGPVARCGPARRQAGWNSIAKASSAAIGSSAVRHKKEKTKSTRRGRFNVRTRVGAICLLSTTFLIPISPAAGGMAEGLAAYRAGDYVTAHAEWLPLAREGGAAAQRNVGQLYRLGQGVPRDAAVAANWYRLAAEQGLARAQSNLAAMYLQGDGVEKNPVIAAEWLRRAAAQGHTLSQFNLGLMYESGFGLGIDLVKARSWYELAADAGNARARERLANLRNVPAEDDVALLPPARPTVTRSSGVPDTGARGLIMPPADPDVAREAELTKVRIAVAKVLRERAALATRTGKTELPPPPFALADARAEQRPVETAPTKIVQTNVTADAATAKKPLPNFLRREAVSDTGIPQFKPLPGFLVAEARRDKPVPKFLRQEAKNDMGALKFKPLPRFLAEEAQQGNREITVAAASPAPSPTVSPATASGVERESSPLVSVVSERLPKPRPAFLRREANHDVGAPRLKPLPQFLVAEVQLNKTMPEIPRREAKGDTAALKFKPLPQYLADEAHQGEREILLAAAPPVTTATKTPGVAQETLPPLPLRRPMKPIPEFLKREAKEPVPLVPPAAGPPARKPLPPTPRIAGADSLSVPLPSFLIGEAKEDRARQFALNAQSDLGPDLGPDLEPHLYAPQAAPAEAEEGLGSEASPAPNFLTLDAARSRATERATESLALASQSLMSEAAPPAPPARLPLYGNEAIGERPVQFALKEEPTPFGLSGQASKSTAPRTIDVKAIPDFLIQEAKQTRRSLVLDLARSLSAILRPARNISVAEIIPPTVAKPVPEFLKREATETRRRTVAALADARAGRRAPTALIADARSTAQADARSTARAGTETPQTAARGDTTSEKPIPEFLRREVRVQRQVADAAKRMPEFLKVEALLDGANFGAFKPVPAFIRQEASEHALVLASAAAKPVPDLIRHEAKLDFGTRTFALQRGPEGATIVRASFVNVGLANPRPAKAGPPNRGSDALPVSAYIKLEAALEAWFVNASPPPPLRIRALVPSKPEARIRLPDRDERPTEPRSAVVLKAVARESDGAPLWLGEPERRQALSGRVVEAGITAYRESDFARAYDLWLAVARRGDADAQFLVGGLYADGTGVVRSLGRAYQWWRLSGDQGHTRAQELLPTLLGLLDEEESALAEGATQAT